MRLRRYLKRIESLVGALPYTASTSLTIDERPADTAFIKGVLVFIDGSELHFMEFLFDDGTVKKDKYSYHYMRSGKPVFRYDNALDPKAKSLHTYPHHKHVDNKMFASEEHDLEGVLKEVEGYF